MKSDRFQTQNRAAIVSAPAPIVSPPWLLIDLYRDKPALDLQESFAAGVVDPKLIYPVALPRALNEQAFIWLISEFAQFRDARMLKL